jgi:hypothetical protein
MREPIEAGTTSLPALGQEAHERLVGRLAELSRAHLLSFRLHVGRAIRDELGDAERALAGFVSAHGDRLAEIGLNLREIRRAVATFDVLTSLPHETASRLEVSHVPELARLPGASERRLIASALLQEGWTVRQLRDAVTQVLRGAWPDMDPEAAGLQPAPPEPAPKRVVAGHVVNGMERTAEDIGASVRALQQKGRGSLSDLHARRLRELCDRMEQQAAGLRGWLDEPPASVEGGSDEGAELG